MRVDSENTSTIRCEAYPAFHRVSGGLIWSQTQSSTRLMNWSVEFFPFFSPELLAACAVLCVAAIALSAWRSRRGVVLRALSLGCLLLALANPNLKNEDRKSLSNIAVVVADASSSMQLAGRNRTRAPDRGRAEGQARENPQSGDALGPRCPERTSRAEKRPTSSARSTPPWPTFRRAAWRARFSSPTARFTMRRRIMAASASTRRCTR